MYVMPRTHKTGRLKLTRLCVCDARKTERPGPDHSNATPFNAGTHSCGSGDIYRAFNLGQIGGGRLKGGATAEYIHILYNTEYSTALARSLARILTAHKEEYDS